MGIVITVVVVVIILAGGGAFILYNPRRETLIPEDVTNFKDFYSGKLYEGSLKGVRSGCSEKFSQGDGDSLILYIHGYKASRAEGEEVIDRAAFRLNASVYYLRLPGHGTTPEDQASVTFNDLLNYSEEALAAVEKVSSNIYLAGTSMGGAIALYLAAQYGPRIKGVILASMFYNFASPIHRLMNHPWVYRLGCIVSPWIKDSDEVDEKSDNWANYWYKDYLFRSVKLLTDLRRYLVKSDLASAVDVPVLMFHSAHDKRASVPAMHRVFEKFPSGMKKIVEVPVEGHILMSRYFPSQLDFITDEVVSFMRSVQSQKSQKPGLRYNK